MQSISNDAIPREGTIKNTRRREPRAILSDSRNRISVSRRPRILCSEMADDIPGFSELIAKRRFRFVDIEDASGRGRRNGPTIILDLQQCTKPRWTAIKRSEGNLTIDESRINAND